MEAAPVHNIPVGEGEQEEAPVEQVHWLGRIWRHMNKKHLLALATFPFGYTALLNAFLAPHKPSDRVFIASVGGCLIAVSLITLLKEKLCCLIYKEIITS